jgi:hypothetical protein
VDASQRPRGQQRGGRERGGGRGGRERGGEGDASARRMLASSRTRFVFPQVTSNRMLQCVQVTDAPAAIVRSSVRPSENVRMTTMTGHGLSGAAGLKKQKTLPPPNRETLAAPTQEALTAPAIGYSNTWPTETETVLVGSYPNWPWMQPQQLQASQVPWMMPLAVGSMLSQVSWMMQPALGSMPYPGPFWPPNAQMDPLAPRTGNMDIAARATRRQKRKLNDDVAAERSSSRRKPRQITVQPGGEIDGACPGKTAWDDAVKGLIPRILDLSVVEWEGQKPEAV